MRGGWAGRGRGDAWYGAGGAGVRVRCVDGMGKPSNATKARRGGGGGGAII